VAHCASTFVVKLSLKAKIYVGLVLLIGLEMLLVLGAQVNAQEPVRFLFYLVLGIVGSHLKVKLPGVMGTLSVNFVFYLLSIIDLPLSQALLVSVAGTVTQTWFHPEYRPRAIQALFNVSLILGCIYIAYQVFHWEQLRHLDPTIALPLFAATAVYFAFNTLAVSGVISLTEGQRLTRVWYENFFWTAPQYLFAALLAYLLHGVNRVLGWQFSVLVLPGIYLIYRSYHLYLTRLRDEKKHVEEIAALHLRTIEALALAIEAKDDTTHAHLRRVQVYARELARHLHLDESQTRALEAAALLHDIGKLAVPEYIINKPGKLTREEFERMKVHPVVGAQILECVQFPYPVVPIVRSHHERWDGTGYPDGLAGEEIPMGARIIAAVDCFDALASDRQYRRALPLEDALAEVRRLAGSALDPKIVSLIERYYLEWEQLAREAGPLPARLETNLRIERGVAPAAGFADISPLRDRVLSGQQADFIASIAAARQEFQMLHEMARELGNSLSLPDTLTMLATRLSALIPHDAIVIYCLRGQELVPEYVAGEDAALFSSLRIPRGEGLSGWVAENQRAVLNGNPSVESGYLGDPRCFSTLRSALAVPLHTASGTLGALALYRREAESFTADHLRILNTVSAKASLTIENALHHHRVEQDAGTDPLTGLANAKTLFLRLDDQIVRAKQDNTTITVLVLDLDGFKQVNDRHGHLQGNRVLQAVAEGLRGLVREGDLLARMGGDEFVVVLRQLPVSALEDRYHAMMHMVAECGRRVCGQRLLSLSVGAAHYPVDGDTVESLLSKADFRMYQMKGQHHLVPAQGEVPEPASAAVH
jgi:diguanylate cyclase (GGDEF)-like protein/putative nucleotidyltransferase with HDIG domain